jgi:hypothetical protein
MPNLCLDTQTKVKRLALASAKLEEDIKNNCDDMGAAGYLLAGCFVAAEQLILIFQKAA